MKEGDFTATNGVYNLNRVLKDEEKQKKSNTSKAYANQFYGTNNTPAEVSSSPASAQSDYGAYLANQNNALNNQRAAAPKSTPSVSQQTTQNTLNNPNNYTLSEYDSKLGIDDQQGIVDAKQAWSDANSRGDKNGTWDAYIDAQVYRAKNGYIDDVGDGSGWREFVLSPADAELPEEARDAVIRYRVMGILDPDNATYYNEKANEIRSTVAGYTSSDGKDYKKDHSVAQNELLNAQFNYGKEFDDSYGGRIDEIINSLSNLAPYEAPVYDPANDPAYRAYEQYYMRNADAASQQALATAASNTGGIANSYAQQLANSAAQSYMKQLSDMIPTLQQNAYQNSYQAWRDSIGDQQALLGTLNTMRNEDYGRYDADRNYAINQWLQNWQNAFNQHQLQQEIANREDEQAWQEQQNQLDRDFEKYLASLK